MVARTDTLLVDPLVCSERFEQQQQQRRSGLQQPRFKHATPTSRSLDGAAVHAQVVVRQQRFVQVG